MVANACPFTVTAMFPPTVRVAVSAVTVPFERTVSPPLVKLKSVVTATDAVPDTLAVSLMCTPCAATSTVVCAVSAVSVAVSAEVRSSRVTPSLTKPERHPRALADRATDAVARVRRRGRPRRPDDGDAEHGRAGATLVGKIDIANHAQWAGRYGRERLDGIEQEAHAVRGRAGRGRYHIPTRDRIPHERLAASRVRENRGLDRLTRERLAQRCCRRCAPREGGTRRDDHWRANRQGRGTGRSELREEHGEALESAGSGRCGNRLELGGRVGGVRELGGRRTGAGSAAGLQGARGGAQQPQPARESRQGHLRHPAGQQRAPAINGDLSAAPDQPAPTGTQAPPHPP